MMLVKVDGGRCKSGSCCGPAGADGNNIQKARVELKSGNVKGCGGVRHVSLLQLRAAEAGNREFRLEKFNYSQRL
jgi:hypothetical protein